MAAPITIESGLSGKINLICLFAAIALLLVFPLKKQIWYDETITIMCSNGISHASPADFANTQELSSEIINTLNTNDNVYKATVLDNGNSYLYNIGLHWFTGQFGYDLRLYTLFSQLCGIAALLAFFVLCNLFFRNTIFTAVAILLFATDTTFVGMSHEVRGYALGMFFISLSGIYFYRFMYEKELPRYLFLCGLFSVATILSHFLSIYIVVVFMGYLLVAKNKRLLARRNLLALTVPILLMGGYLYGALWGIKSMNIQNATIQKTMVEAFTIKEVFFRAFGIFAIDFKSVFVAFRSNWLTTIASAALVPALYITALRAANDKEKKRNLHLLFLLGISASLFLFVLCIRAHHYTALYHRYHSFALPFASLFIAYALYTIYTGSNIGKIVKGGIAAIFLLPAIVYYTSVVAHHNPKLIYNHTIVAQQIMQYKMTKIEVPEWKDAFLVNSFLPKSYVIDYVLNKTSPYFTLYKGNTVEQLPVINK